MSDIPEDVLSVKKQILADPEEPLNSIIEQLTEIRHEIKTMWKSLESRKIGEDNLWVWGFLRTVENAKEVPKFHNKTAKERRELSEMIEKHTKQLSILLRANDLDAHIIQCEGDIFNGFYLYEEFGEKNQEFFDSHETNKLNISAFLKNYATYCQERIKDEPLPGKSGKNSKAIRFIRKLATRNMRSYEQPLNAVIATATNAIFHTNYSESDITNLLNR